MHKAWNAVIFCNGIYFSTLFQLYFVWNRSFTGKIHCSWKTVFGSFNIDTRRGKPNEKLTLSIFICFSLKPLSSFQRTKYHFFTHFDFPCIAGENFFTFLRWFAIQVAVNSEIYIARINLNKLLKLNQLKNQPNGKWV